jgi:two-component system NarL family sensor kinase
VGGLLQELKVNALMDVQLVEEPEACRELSEEQTTALFHIAQESLTNVRKHARAHTVRAHLAEEHGVFRMTIRDDGDGFDPAHHAPGLGLRNMRERAESLGGRLDVTSGNGHGTELHVELPVRAKGA